MDSLKDSNSVYYSYAIINFLWYALCGIVILFLGSIIAKHAFGFSMETLSIQIPIEAGQVTLQTAIDSSMISIESAMASLDIDYIIDNYLGLYIGLILSLIIAMALFLAGFFQFRMILKSALNDDIFTSKNIKRLKIVAGLLIVYTPFKWIVYQLFVMPIDSELIANEIAISLNFELGSFIYGLLLFALAAVFEKGHDMYQELKLTV
jgi:hypothetical protein